MDYSYYLGQESNVEARKNFHLLRSEEVVAAYARKEKDSLKNLYVIRFGKNISSSMYSPSRSGGSESAAQHFQVGTVQHAEVPA